MSDLLIKRFFGKVHVGEELAFPPFLRDELKVDAALINPPLEGGDAIQLEKNAKVRIAGAGYKADQI